MHAPFSRHLTRNSLNRKLLLDEKPGKRQKKEKKGDRRKGTEAINCS
jgi:hypothetical protein